MFGIRTVTSLFTQSEPAAETPFSAPETFADMIGAHVAYRFMESSWLTTTGIILDAWDCGTHVEVLIEPFDETKLTRRFDSRMIQSYLWVVC